MALPSRKAIPPCCASFTSSCCRSFSSSSTASTVAQTKTKPRPYTDYSTPQYLPRLATQPFARSKESTSSGAYASRGRDPLPPTSRFPPNQAGRSSQSSTGSRFSSPARPGYYSHQQQDRTGVNKLGAPDAGWGPRKPLPSPSTFGGNTRSSGQGWGVLSRSKPSSSSSIPFMGTNGESSSTRKSYVENDLVVSKGASSTRSELNHRLEREKHRKEEELLHDLRLSRELRAQRVAVQNKVAKGVAKLKELEKVREVYLGRHIKVGELAGRFGVRLERLQEALMKAGMEQVAYDHLLDSEDAALLAPEFGCTVIIDEGAAFDIIPAPLPADISTLPHRPPIVTIMGHVDHGKTTLLDTLRNAAVAAGEAGGITQHLGAFTLPVSSLSTSKTTPASNSTSKSGGKNERMITFLDTPGHAAFSAMRARGAGCTDVVVLVVAADDGVMPQTKEVIELVQKEQGRVGLVVAINKIDKPGADPMNVKHMLLANGVQLEEFGGEVPAVEVSGLTGQGLDNLMETVSLVSELMDVRAEDKGQSVGVVLESKVEKGFGPVATVLLLRGELTPGSHLICGTTSCRVRSLTSSTSQTVKALKAGHAASVSGWSSLPSAGDSVLQAKEEEIKRALVNRKRNAAMGRLVDDVEAINEKRRLEREKREQELEAAKIALEKGERVDINKAGLREDELSAKEKDDTIKELRLIIKADVSGSAEAIAGALEGIGNAKAKVKVVSFGVGAVSEGDLTLAKAIDASIVAFNTPTPRPMLQLAHTQNIPLISSDIIYRLMETVQSKVVELLPKIIEHKVTGEANIQQQFEIDMGKRQKLKVAGCRVSNGMLEKNKQVKLVRNGAVIYEGSLETFKHLKKDITEARKGMECGLSIDGYKGEFMVGDSVQCYEIITRAASL